MSRYVLYKIPINIGRNHWCKQPEIEEDQNCRWTSTRCISIYYLFGLKIKVMERVMTWPQFHETYATMAIMSLKWASPRRVAQENPTSHQKRGSGQIINWNSLSSYCFTGQKGTDTVGKAIVRCETRQPFVQIVGKTVSIVNTYNTKV